MEKCFKQDTINYNARTLVNAARNNGMKDKEIASLCGVNVGSVARWRSTGSARKSKIVPLENLFVGYGVIRKDIDVIANMLIDIHDIKGDYAIARFQLVRISGRKYWGNKNLQKLKDELIERNFHLVESYDHKLNNMFLIIRDDSLMKQFKDKGLSNEEISHLIVPIIEETREEEF